MDLTMNIVRINHEQHFPTCQVKVVRFYVSCPARLLARLPPPPPDLNCKR